MPYRPGVGGGAVEAAKSLVFAGSLPESEEPDELILPAEPEAPPPEPIDPELGEPALGELELGELELGELELGELELGELGADAPELPPIGEPPELASPAPPAEELNTELSVESSNS